MDETLIKELDAIERLAQGGVPGRFFKNPLRYLSAIGYWRLVYPLRKRGRYAKARTFFGAEMEVVLPSATEIFLFGAKTHDSEIRLARFLIKTLRPGDVFCDVGAHFGFFTLLAARLTGETGRVFAFEASNSTFEILKKNTAQSGTVAALHRAASDENKILMFSEFPALFSEYNSLVLPDPEDAAWLRANPPKRIEVQGRRLDDFFAELNQKHSAEAAPILPTLIKIDVEGAEPQVLRGMERFIAKHRPVIVMEYLATTGQNESHRKAVEYARSFDYEVFRIINDGSLRPCADVEAAMQKDGLDSDNIVLRSAHQ